MAVIMGRQSGYKTSSSGEERGRAAGPHLPERPGGRQGHDSGASGCGHLGHSGEHERVELSATELLSQGKVPYSGEPAATRGRKRSLSLEARSIAAEGDRKSVV